MDFLYRNLELHLEDASGGPGESDNSVFVKNSPEAGGGYKLKVKMSTILSFLCPQRQKKIRLIFKPVELVQFDRLTKFKLD